MFIEAMGGRLEIIAQFPEGDFRISQFRDLEVKKILTMANVIAYIKHARVFTAQIPACFKMIKKTKCRKFRVSKAR